MLAPQLYPAYAANWQAQEDAMVLEAAEHCRALRQTLEAPPSIRRKPRSPEADIKQKEQKLREKELSQLLRDQQQLLEDQKWQLQEQQRLMEEKDLQLKNEARQLAEDRLVAQRWQQLASLRQRQLEQQEAQQLQLEERLAQGVGAFAAQNKMHGESLRGFAAERLKARQLEEELRALELRHTEELRRQAAALAPRGGAAARCALFAPTAPVASVLWGSLPLRQAAQEVEVQASVWAVDADVQTDKASVDQEVQTGEDTEVVELEDLLEELRNELVEEKLQAAVRQKHRDQELQRCKSELEDMAKLQEELEAAEDKLQTPEYVLHSELQQAYGNLRDMDTTVRMQEDRVQAVSKSCEQRVELMRDQSQTLMEQTRVQASQAALEYSMEQQKTSSLQEQLAAAEARRAEDAERLQGLQERMALAVEEAALEEENLNSALAAQRAMCEEHCSRFQQEQRLRESVAVWLKDSWRRCELQPALEQAKVLRQVMEEDQRTAEALQFENHAILLEAAQKQAALSFCSTEVAFARAEVDAWKRDKGELSAKLEKEEMQMLHEEAVIEESRFLEASAKREAAAAKEPVTARAQQAMVAQAAQMTQQASSFAEELRELRVEAASLRRSFAAEPLRCGVAATADPPRFGSADAVEPPRFGVADVCHSRTVAFDLPALGDVNPDKE